VAKSRIVHNEVEFVHSKALKGNVRHSVKMAAINAQSSTHIDRKKLEKRGGKQKHKGQGNLA
jgi:hypothetical protein